MQRMQAVRLISLGFYQEGMIEKQWSEGFKTIGKKALEVLYLESWLVGERSDSWRG